MSFARGEINLLPIPFTDLTRRKARPAVVIGHSSHAGDLFVVLSDISQGHNEAHESRGPEERIRSAVPGGLRTGPGLEFFDRNH